MLTDGKSELEMRDTDYAERFEAQSGTPMFRYLLSLIKQYFEYMHPLH